jgi:hypothetical protein
MTTVKKNVLAKPLGGNGQENGNLTATLEAIIGPPLILDGESGDRYCELYDRVRDAVQPNDMIEELWARDIVDLVWETLRLRRLKLKLMRAYAYQGLQRLLAPLVPGERVSLRDGFGLGSPAAVKRVERVLAKAGLDKEYIFAATLAAKLDDLETACAC